MAKCSEKGCPSNATHQVDDKLLCKEHGSEAKRGGAYVRVAHPEESRPEPETAEEIEE